MLGLTLYIETLHGGSGCCSCCNLDDNKQCQTVDCACVCDAGNTTGCSLSESLTATISTSVGFDRTNRQQPQQLLIDMPIDTTNQDLSKWTMSHDEYTKLIVSSEHKSAFIKIMRQFTTDDQLLRRVQRHFTAEMDAGLRGDRSSLAMLPSFVPALPTGYETGRYLAMDLGGTNLRVLMMVFGQPALIQQRTFKVPQSTMTGTGEQLFDFVSRCLYEFCDEYAVLDTGLSLGFTFSYPMDQTSLKHATLLRWTKGFTVTGVVGNDVINLLEKSLRKYPKLKVNVTSILNDTVGAQVATAYEHKGNCDLGVIIGTGTNAAYMEETKKIVKLPKNADYKYDHMIIDTEWGAFAEGPDFDYLLNEFDREVDAMSTHPKEYIYDKLVAGMYIGSLARLALLSLVKADALFPNDHVNAVQQLSQRDVFPTKYVTEVLRDDTTTLRHSRHVIDDIGIVNASVGDVLMLRYVCQQISHRSACLVAAAMAAMIERIGKQHVTIGIDGTLFAEHPHYADWLHEKLAMLLTEGVKVDIVQAGDGSGRGAACVAAIADKMNLH